MSSSSISNTSHYINSIPGIRLSNIVSLCFGFSLVFSAPYSGGFFFKNLIIPFIGSYSITIFEAFLIPFAYFYFTVYGFRIKRREQLLFLSIILVICSRIISLIVGEGIEIEQWISVLRYVETLGSIYVFTNLMSEYRNRHFFILGIIVGVTIEATGEIITLLILGRRGIFIGFSTIFEIFLVFICIFTFMKRRHQFAMAVLTSILFMAILATQTRGALIALAILIITATLYGIITQRRFSWRPISIVILIVFMVFAVNLIFSSAIAVVTNRTIVAFDYKEGSVAERLYMWDQCLGTFLENPITGIGSGSFARKVGELSQLFKFKLPSYYDPTTSFRAHSLIFGLIAETGIVGLSAYFCWIIAITISSLKVLRLGNVSSKDDIYAIVAALLILGVPIGDLIGEFSFVAPSNWLIAFVYGWLRYRLRNDQSKGYGNKI